MKLRKLKLKNINSFRDEIILDFEDAPLGDAPLVAITGPTGAGKTTLLDAICVALYGKTPRLTGSGTQNPNNLISHGEKECFAEVHFAANNTQYTATWSVRRGSSPRGSLINADTKELISDKLSSRGKSLGSSEKTISEEINSIMGLDFNGFKRSIMLAQGEFAAFLKAKDEERRKILETTAGIHIYDELKQILNDQVNEVSNKYILKKLQFDSFADTSPEQLKELNDELNSMQEETEKLNKKLQEIQNDKRQETERKNQYDNLKSSKERLDILKGDQQKIDNYKLELDRAEQANQLRAEKSTFDTTNLDYQRSETALNTASTELEEAQKQMETNQSVFTDKEKTYVDISTTHEERSAIYTQAKADLARAAERFEEVNRRKPTLEELDTKITQLANDLSEKQQRQNDLENQISEAQTFLKQNPLPSDRDTRLISLTKLQENINSKSEQLEDKVEDQSEHTSKIEELNDNLEKQLEKRNKLQSELETLADREKKAQQKYNELQDHGSHEDWQNRKDTAITAQLIVQKHEISSQQLQETEEELRKAEDRLNTVDKSLADLEKKLITQSDLCEQADVKVEELKKERELAMLADSINHLRHQLIDGEPCHVCGATDHPYSDRVEPESEELIRGIKEKLDVAENDASENHKQKQNIQNEQVRFTQDKTNITQQLNRCNLEIANIKEQIVNQQADWEEHYEDLDISREWIENRIKKADEAIDNLNTAQDAYDKAKNRSDEVSQKLAICESEHTHQTTLLTERKQQLNDVNEEIEDLKAEIASAKGNFWESTPQVFHTDTTDQALSNFSEMIEKVSSHELKLVTDQNQLALLNSEIENENSNHVTSKQRKTELAKEIEQYQNEGDEILNSVSDKTDGLVTEDEINDSISKLDIKLQNAKSNRDDAYQRLIESQKLLTEKTTSHQFCANQLTEDNEKFQAASKTYHEKLVDFGFDSPEDHNTAFREESQIQELEDTIDAHKDEIRSLNDTISELTTEFDNSPYDPDMLRNITTEEGEIEEQIQNLHTEIGGKKQIITDLEGKLDKREALDKELKTAEQEMDKWKNLQDIIPQNKLRDFALDLKFQEVSKRANVQLADLTSERYQLKVETIGKLSVVDRSNANEERPVETLSGGESFLTSLALALALSELSQGRTQLTSLFLDEGFGTLDADTLDTVIAALEGLRMQGRNIYIISHIQELTRRLPVKINVRKKGDGSSTIDIKG